MNDFINKPNRKSSLNSLLNESKRGLKKIAFVGMANKLRREGNLPNSFEDYLIGPIIGIGLYEGAEIEDIVFEIAGNLDISEYYVSHAYSRKYLFAKLKSKKVKRRDKRSFGKNL